MTRMGGDFWCFACYMIIPTASIFCYLSPSSFCPILFASLLCLFPYIYFFYFSSRYCFFHLVFVLFYFIFFFHTSTLSSTHMISSIPDRSSMRWHSASQSSAAFFSGFNHPVAHSLTVSHRRPVKM